jgi:hypothetical protein
MAERIENLEFQNASGEPAKMAAAERTNLFFDGPAEFLVIRVVQALKADATWKKLFGEFIEPYQRMDFPLRSPPVMRIYNEAYTKDAESWFVNGDLKVDMIWPATIRRSELQQIPDTAAAALLQQFRRTTFFQQMCDAVPGLNELGKRFTVDKTLGFEWQDAETPVLPLTQITVNFRIDLREWDRYLEETNRTKDSPFEAVLGDLRRIAYDNCGGIIGVNDEAETEVRLGIDFKPGGNDNA